MADHRLKINFCDTVDLLALSDVGAKTVKSIAKFREQNGNITSDTLECVPKLRVWKRLFEAVDFAPNPQYDYSALGKEWIEDSSRKAVKKQREPDADVIGRLTQVISSGVTTPKFSDRHESQSTYRGALPKGRPENFIPEMGTTKQSGQGSVTRNTPLKISFHDYHGRIQWGRFL